MLQLIPGIYPPGGHAFYDSDGILFVGENVYDLVHKVWAYRRRVGQDATGTWDDVQGYLCRKHPTLCREVAQADRRPRLDLIDRLTDDAVDLMTQKELGRLQLTEKATMTERTAICAQCPRRVDWASNCPPCRKNLQTILAAVVSPEKLQKTLEGTACELAGDDLSLAVWKTEGKTLNDAPENCWRKQTPDSLA